MAVSTLAVLGVLRVLCSRLGSKAAAARQLGVSVSYLDIVLREKQALSGGLAEKLGYRKVVTWERFRTLDGEDVSPRDFGERFPVLYANRGDSDGFAQACEQMTIGLTDFLEVAEREGILMGNCWHLRQKIGALVKAEVLARWKGE